MKQKVAIIIGAGPAGLTAALELLTRTDIKPIILEKSEYIGGISKTITYKNNRIDIGGHRFFSKSDRVMNWWLNIFPIIEKDITDKEKVMLIRNRLSRIYFEKKFFDYPISLSFDTLQKLGFWRILAIGFSYLKTKIFPIANEKNLEQFFINRFGKKLYHLFFKDYTEKVWGVPCQDISAEWGGQRIKELSITRTVIHAIRSKFNLHKKDITQKNIDTSLIEQFLYPKYGPGQFWEEVARLIIKMGGTIHHHYEAKTIRHQDTNIVSLDAFHHKNNMIENFKGDYFFSTMSVQELIQGFEPAAPSPIVEIASGLLYRDFITVGLLVKKLLIIDKNSPDTLIKDTWLYIQDNEVRMGRLQIFNNWSPYMVSDPNYVWIGLEYFCNKGDELWNKTDNEFICFAIEELIKIRIIADDVVIDHTIRREEKTYPVYFGTYNRFQEIREYTNQFHNLFLIGRNGMHKYNNSDHSMLTAMVSVDNIIDGITNKENLWKINTEQDYHEKK